MQAAAIQFEIRGEAKAAALERMAALLESVRGCELILLPELWPTGFFQFERFAQDAEDLEGPLVSFLRERAKALRTHLFTGSFVERDGAKLYNTSLLLDAGGNIQARYRKIHLFGHGGSREPQHLSAGIEVIVTDTPWGRAGLSTCYDLRFPELYRRMIDQGAKIFLVASAWPQARLDAWRLFTTARAAENQALLLACNCTGISAGNALGGGSRFVDPAGTVLASAGSGEQVLRANIASEIVQTARQAFGALNDRVL